MNEGRAHFKLAPLLNIDAIAPRTAPRKPLTMQVIRGGGPMYGFHPHLSAPSCFNLNAAAAKNRMNPIMAKRDIR